MRHLMNTLYVITPQSYLRLENENVVIEQKNSDSQKVPLHVLEGIITFGSLGISPALMGACVAKGVSVSFLDIHGAFLARVDGAPAGNVLLRKTQYNISDRDISLSISKRFVAAKTRNQRVVLQRSIRDHPEKMSKELGRAVAQMSSLEQLACTAETKSQLMGIEGKIADLYFHVFGELVLVDDPCFSFEGRNRRPPKDAVNSLLSLFYSLLSHDVASACNTVGLDPYVGFFHVDRPGRLSLALDLMEELRAYLVDRFVLSLINRKQLRTSDFVFEPDGAVFLKDSSRKEVIGQWQQRKQEELLHPFLKEKVPVGLLPYVQAKLLSRYLRGDIEDYPAFLWR